ncbi:MAG: hypothetical protein JJT76_06870 [Clostridiaceae bacterium]|nr:hypothetical protein [Clostridiaceae bacterium]
MMKVVSSNDVGKLRAQIQALEWTLQRDTRKKDIEYHTMALNILKDKLKRIEGMDKL